jgi:glycosyltransferase involved in cell wall biosynthesis
MTIRYGFLSSHPPTQCGLATFNLALAAHLAPRLPVARVVRVLLTPDQHAPPSDVVHTWRAGTGEPGWQAAAAALNHFDVAIIQHEYGIYPGPAGADLLKVLRGLRVPVIVVLHTVLSNPDARQRLLLEEIVAAADAIVTMTDTARKRLLSGYVADSAKVHVIPHGTADLTRRTSRRSAVDPDRRPRLLTWGLLGPGKGLEWAIQALARLQDLHPAPTYTIAGRTHPNVLAHQGERYREGLRRLSVDLAISSSVRFDPVFHDTAALGRLIHSADVVVLPYDSREQVTSGVLIEAVAAGVPVVATRFPHAVELLARGAGLLVDHEDPQMLAGAIRRILTQPAFTAELIAARRGLADGVRWPAVAARYAELARRLVRLNPDVPAHTGADVLPVVTPVPTA